MFVQEEKVCDYEFKVILRFFIRFAERGCPRFVTNRRKVRDYNESFFNVFSSFFWYKAYVPGILY